MKLLGIETSCDETAAAVVEDGRHAHSNVVASQIDIHKEFGGVVPEVAARSHIEVILPVIHEALDKAFVADWRAIDIGSDDIQKLGHY
jgi:N6-L-threonylcarbamoyladenine synthase